MHKNKKIKQSTGSPIPDLYYIDKAYDVRKYYVDLITANPSVKKEVLYKEAVGFHISKNCKDPKTFFGNISRAIAYINRMEKAHEGAQEGPETIPQEVINPALVEAAHHLIDDNRGNIPIDESIDFLEDIASPEEVKRALKLCAA